MANPNTYADLARLKAYYSKIFLVKVSNFEPDDDYSDYKDDRLSEALRDASDRIDGFLAARYSTPILPAPEWFPAACMVIAIAILIERKGYQKDTPEEKVVEAADKYLKQFADIARGLIDIAIPGSEGGGTTPPAQVVATYPDKIFPETLLDKY
jgi:phage gp36-like protein